MQTSKLYQALRYPFLSALLVPSLQSEQQAYSLNNDADPEN